MVMVIMIVIQYLLEKNLFIKQNFLLQLARVSKEHKMLVKIEIPKQKFQVLSDFKTKFF